MRHRLAGEYSQFLFVSLSYRSNYKFNKDTQEYNAVKITKITQVETRLTFVSGIEYNLVGIACHSGSSIFLGHYFTFVKDGTQWLKIDDMLVNRYREKRMLREVAEGTESTAYILLYEKCSDDS